MNTNFLFLCFAFCLFCMSVITITIAPIISKAHSSFFNGWGTTNCKVLDVDLDFQKSIGAFDEYRNAQKIEERKIDECNYRNIMYSLEYSAIIIDVSLGFFIAFLSLINYLEPGNNCKKEIGLFGLVIGVICAAITGVYLGYSSYIFSNHHIRDISILYSNKASWKWNGQKYVPDYDENDVTSDYDKQFIKIKDLGKKQYNYDSDIYQALKDSKSEVSGCRSSSLPKERAFYNNGKPCEYIWLNDIPNDSVEYKYLFDRWLTTIIFSAVICVLGIGLCLFGFLTFNSDQTPLDNEQSKPVPITSSVNSVSRLRNERQNNIEVADNAENKENEENKNN